MIDRIVQGTIEQRGRNLLLELVSDETNRLQETIEMETRFGAGENHRCVVHEKQLLLNPLAKVREGRQPLTGTALLIHRTLNFVAGLGDGLFVKIPLVDHQDAGFLGFDDLAGDFLVLHRHPTLGIHHMDGDVAALNGIFGPLDTEKLHRVRHPSFLANAGGVDQDIGMPLPFILDFDGHVHRVARGSGNGADNHAFGLSEGIDDARLSDVRAPNDR